MTVAQTRPYHHGNLRSALLACAERALDEGGAAQLSLREIARQVGVSHAAPRRHFPDKQALLDALAEDGFERLGGELREAVDAAGEGFHARLLALAQTYVRFATEHAALLELMYAGKHRPGADDSLREAGERTFEAPMRLIAAGQAAGDVVGGDPARVGVAAWAAVHGLASLVNSELIDGDALDERVAEAVALLVEGLRPR